METEEDVGMREAVRGDREMGQAPPNQICPRPQVPRNAAGRLATKDLFWWLKKISLGKLGYSSPCQRRTCRHPRTWTYGESKRRPRVRLESQNGNSTRAILGLVTWLITLQRESSSTLSAGAATYCVGKSRFWQWRPGWCRPLSPSW